jgi:hypothetical protein
MSKRMKLSKSLCANNRGKIALGLIIVLMITIPISLALATASVQPPTQTGIPTAPQNVADPNTQFQIHVAYAYVGLAPSSISSYFNQETNTTMRLISQYPSSVQLNISRVPNAQIAGCDAAVEVYGIKITTDTGLSEYDAYFIGTNYNSSLSNETLSTLIQYVPNLYNASLYITLAGNFKSNWDSNSSFLTNTLGSSTVYVASDSSSLGLFSAGKPNAISVTVHRIGYVTIANGSVTVFEDPSNNPPTDTVQLDNYQSGFLKNDLIPSAQLPQVNLFKPVAHP